MNSTFIWYPSIPAPCEGDDDPSRILVFRLRLSTETQSTQVIMALERMYGGYVQLWEFNSL